MTRQSVFESVTYIYETKVTLHALNFNCIYPIGCTKAGLHGYHLVTFRHLCKRSVSIK